jgi:hypothetical protein
VALTFVLIKKRRQTTRNLTAGLRCVPGAAVTGYRPWAAIGRGRIRPF